MTFFSFDFRSKPDAPRRVPRLSDGLPRARGSGDDYRGLVSGG